ncbi:MAG: ferrous iron transporter B [Bacteroidetes bacterium]|nr:ferrous iron transporter B [Bacteroidota bacterium]
MKRELSQKNIIITGLANTGKTTLFNRLTGAYGLVANYPMTTIDPQNDKYTFQGTKYNVSDLPGMNGLLANSEEELIFRKEVCGTVPDILIQCIDAGRLKQSLYLTSELLYMNIPLVICLTSIDETTRSGNKIDSDLLSRILQVPVIEVGETGKWGVYDVKEAVVKAAEYKTHIIYPDPVEQQLNVLRSLIPDTIGWGRQCAVLSMMDDPYISDSITKGSDYLFFGLSEEIRKDIDQKKKALLENVTGNPSVMIMKERGNWVDGIYNRVVKSSERVQRTKDGVFAGNAAYYSRHPVWGFLFLAVFIFVSYLLVVDAAGWFSGKLDQLISTPVVSLLDQSISSVFWKNLLIGDYGVLTLGLFNAVITVLPILTIFFLLLGLLEDIGYLPNLSLLLRRAFNRLGLSGKAVMPIILGFGCKTMATMTTRSLKSRKERLIAIFLIAFALPCSAQLGLNMAILGNAGFSAFIIAGVILVLVEVITGTVLNRIIPNDTKQVFIQELPPFRVPSLAAITKKRVIVFGGF